MSLFSAQLAFFALFSGLAIARVPNCSITWEWSFNSLGQDPCTVAAYMLSTCTNNGSFAVEALQQGNAYYVPNDADDLYSCMCNTVIYSLLSACAGCQGEKWFTWLRYSFNCTTKSSLVSPNTVPPGTCIPRWALLNVTNMNDWDSNESYDIGDSPEVCAGTIIGTLGPSVHDSSTLNTAMSNTATSSDVTSNTAKSNPATPNEATSNTATSNPATIATLNGATSNTPTPLPVGGRSSNVGGLAGGIVGGIAVVSILVSMLLFYRRRRRSLAPSAAFNPDMMYQVQRPVLGQGAFTSSFPETTTSLMKPHNPDDPSTFLGYQVM